MQSRACTAEVRVSRHRQDLHADARGIDAMLDIVATAHDLDALVTLPEHGGSLALPGGIAEIRRRRASRGAPDMASAIDLVAVQPVGHGGDRVRCRDGELSLRHRHGHLARLSKGRGLTASSTRPGPCDRPCFLHPATSPTHETLYL